MKLAIFVIALIALANCQATVWVSPTTTLAKVYQSAAQKAASTATTNLKAAAAALTKAQTDRKTAQVPTTKWTDFTAAQTAVTTKRTALGVQDTALAALVKGQTDAANTLAVDGVNSQCVVLTAATRKAWQTQSKTVTPGAGAFKTAEDAFKAPEASAFGTLGSELKTAITNMNAAITTGSTQANANQFTPVDAANPQPKDYKIWDPTKNAATAQAGSYQKLKCPNMNSILCKDCAAGAVTVLVKASILITTECTFEKMMAWSVSLGNQYTTLGTVNTAVGKLTALGKILKDATTNKDYATVLTKQAAYQAKLTAVAGTVTAYVAQVDKLAALLATMQTESKLAMANSLLMKTATAANALAAKAIMDAAGTAETAASGAVGAAKTASDAAALKVKNQWTVLNTTVGKVTGAMAKTRMAVGALGNANGQLMGALKAQGIAHELYTSSQASDTWATDQQKQLAALATLSKTDYDNVVAMKKASGSSMIQTTVSLITGFIILLGYRKF